MCSLRGEIMGIMSRRRQRDQKVVVAQEAINKKELVKPIFAEKEIESAQETPLKKKGK